MNKILNLFDEAYVLNLFNQEVLPLYPAFKKIKTVAIKAIKNNVWEKTYHVVIKFTTTFIDETGAEITLPLYCSAHSSEPRRSSFAALSFLWQKGFARGQLTLPRPLFFSEYFNGYFYRGVRGKNLYHYISRLNFKEIENIIPRAAAWFAKLHALPAEQAENFNQLNSRVVTVIPGYEQIFARLKNDYPNQFDAYRETFEHINNREEKFLSQSKNLWLIHGDAHPENVIKMSRQTTAVIDFTDICLADFARDLGAFSQQLEFMSLRKIFNPTYIAKIKKLFLDSYFAAAGIKPDEALRQRINLYYCWTSLRTATLFLMKEAPEPERAHTLLNKARQDLKLK